MSPGAPACKALSRRRSQAARYAVKGGSKEAVQRPCHAPASAPVWTRRERPGLLARVHSAVFKAPLFPAHELLDSGAGEKLERFGERVLRRPDPQALWNPRDEAVWRTADWRFEPARASGGQRGQWLSQASSRELDLEANAGAWSIRFGAATAVLRPTAFKHVGIFPEQASNWVFLQQTLARIDARPARVLNLFGYTGVASVIALQAGAQVTHVDASKTSLAWARENLVASGLAPDAMRLMLDDALGFARKAARRGERYEVILADPPHHGRGPRGEEWQFEEHVAELVRLLEELLAPKACLIFSTYAFGFSPLGLASLLQRTGQVEAGELALLEAPLAAGAKGAQAAPRALACGACARVARGVDLSGLSLWS